MFFRPKLRPIFLVGGLLPVLAGPVPAVHAAITAAPSIAAPDYPNAAWVPADPTNYTVANRGHDYPIDMIVIHDIEGDAASAIKDFQSPNYGGSAHYVVDYNGSMTQMVREKDIAWHAGNWEYNTRAIGIEHAGYACCNYYTTAEYDASAALAASICSRYGVPMDRTHVIGHDEVPDPNNPGLFGGSDHHTDPGPYWNWTYYMAQAQADTKSLPSPPHVMPDPVATNGPTSATVTWTAARTCRTADAPITGYTVTGQPGNLSVDLPATATTYTFDNLTPGTSYTFTVTAHNSYGDGAATSNPTTPGRCSALNVTTNPASAQKIGYGVQFTADATGCPNPLYQYWMLPPGSSTWRKVQAYGATAGFSWDTTGLAPGTYDFSIWAEDAASPGNDSNSLGSWDSYRWMQYTLDAAPCSSTTASFTPPATAAPGTTVTVAASSAGCPNPRYEFWIRPPGSSSWQVAQAYSSNATFTWTTTGARTGTYDFSVWARDASSTGAAGDSLGSWDAYAAAQYSLSPVRCASVTAADSAAGSTTVNITGQAAGCPNPLYEFWILTPGSQTWRLAQAYSTSASFGWNTSGLASGTYRFIVMARDSSSPGAYSSSVATWDSYAVLPYTVAGTSCTGASANASPPGTAARGTTVTITAAATGCPNARYEFWMLAPGSQTWQLVQGYSSSATLSWSTTGKAAGTYRFSIWVRDAQSSGTSGDALGTWDSYAGLAYQLT